MANIENNGEKFSLEKFEAVQTLTKLIVKETANQIQAGMSEIEGNNILERILEQYHVEKLWHPSKVRFGINTNKTFRERSQPDVVLKENDIFFLDIGIVYEDHEGDYGETFLIGDAKRFKDIKMASETLFNAVRKHWGETQESGAKLYDFAKKQAQLLGYTLDESMDGHRLGDFPHALHFKGGLAEIASVPGENLWVLEILLKSKDLSYGAFYEDVLKR